MYRRYYDEVLPPRSLAIQFNEDDLMHDSEQHLAKYFQFDVDCARTGHSSYRSHSLEDNVSFPDDPASMFNKEQVPAWKWDEVTVQTSG